MTSSTKKQINFRLKESVIKELKSLSERRRVSQADVIAILIHWMYTDGDDVEKLDEAFNTAESI